MDKEIIILVPVFKSHVVIVLLNRRSWIRIHFQHATCKRPDVLISALFLVFSYLDFFFICAASTQLRPEGSLPDLRQ